MRKQKSIKKNYLYNLIFQLSLVVIPLITTPYISRVLNADGIGMYSYTLSIVTYFSMFATLGIAVYGQLEISGCRDDIEKRSKTFWEIVIARLVTSFVVCLVYFIFIFFNSKYQVMYLILLLNIFNAMIDVSWYFQGIEEFRLTVTRNIIIKVLGTICIFLFVKQSGDVYKYAFILQGTIVLGNLCLWPYLRKEIKRVDIKSLKFYKHWKKSIVYFIPTFATSIYTVLDKSMIGWITGSEFQNGYYEQAHKIEQTLVTLITSLGTVTMPRIKYLLQNNKKEEMRNIIDNAMDFIIFMSVPMTFGLFIVSDNLIPFFLGSKYLECTTILKIFSILMVVVGLDSTIGRQCLMASGRQRQFNIGVICGALVNFVLNLILIRYFSAVGAAIASVCAEIVILTIFVYYSRDLLNIRKMVKSLIKYSIYSLIMSAVALPIAKSLHLSNVKTMMVMVGVAISVYMFINIITRDEMIRKTIQIVKNKLRKKEV